MKFNFKLTEEEAQIVLNALLKEPCGLVIDVVNNIQQQAVEQRQKESQTSNPFFAKPQEGEGNGV